MKNNIILLIGLFLGISAMAQEKFYFNGYVSNMGQAAFSNQTNDVNWDFIMHNRLNLTYYANDKFTFHVEARNQFLWGETVELIPGYAKSFEQDAGWLDLNFNWWNASNNLFNTQFDRAFVEYVSGNFEMSLGRQRVNWGRSLVWNPNDIFNAFSYYDFDYMERPGSDALRLNYYFGTASSAELVASVDSANNLTVAAMGKINKWGYDMQLVGAYVDEEDLMLGAGWEGNIKSVAFRGEASYYYPTEQWSDTTGSFLASVGFDYLLTSTLTAQLEFLYNDKKNLLNLSQDPSAIFRAPASSKTLSFSEYNIFGNLMWQINPLLTANVAGMYYTDFKGYFLMPAVDFSISNNLYFSLMYQYFNLETLGDRQGSNLVYARLKWNF